MVQYVSPVIKLCFSVYLFTFHLSALKHPPPPFFFRKSKQKIQLKKNGESFKATNTPKKGHHIIYNKKEVLSHAANCSESSIVIHRALCLGVFFVKRENSSEHAIRKVGSNQCHLTYSKLSLQRYSLVVFNL